MSERMFVFITGLLDKHIRCWRKRLFNVSKVSTDEQNTNPEIIHLKEKRFPIMLYFITICASTSSSDGQGLLKSF